MKIFKFNESVNSVDIFKDMFEEALNQLEDIKDLLIEVEDSNSFTFAYNFCVYYPGNKKFLYSDVLVETYKHVIDEFPGNIKDDILHGECNISYLIGIAVGDFDVFDYETFEDEGADTIFAEYNQENLSNWVKLTQVLKQFDLRIKKDKYNVKYQFDNDGVTILVGRISI